MYASSSDGPAAPLVFRAMDLIKDWVEDNRIDIRGHALVDGVKDCCLGKGVFAFQGTFDCDLV